MASGKPKTDYSQLFAATEITDIDVHPSGLTAICAVNDGINWGIAQLNLSSGRVSTILPGNRSRSLLRPSHSPSGDRITYQMDFEGNENHDVFVANADGSRTKRITDSVEDNFEPHFSPDGGTIAFLSNRKDDVENLYAISSSGGKIRRLTNESLPVREHYWSPDGRKIVYATGVGDDDYISLVDVAKAKSKRVLSKKSVEHWLAGEYGGACPWHADGTKFLFRSNENDVLDVLQFDITRGRAKMLVKSQNEKYQPQWSPDGRGLAYLEVADPNLLLKIKIGARTRTVSPPAGLSRNVKWLPNGGLVFINGSSIRPDEVFVVKDTVYRKISRLQRKPLDRKLLYRQRLVSYKSFDGVRIWAQLFVPKERTRKAGIVLPHGGPDAQDLDAWDQLTIMLLDKGFAVIKPNYRGSTGYGRKFNHLHDRDLGGGDFMDTVHAGKYLIDSGLVAENRLGYWGASYSGFTCMLALSKTPEMWAAGVSIVGFFDWETAMATERGYLKAYDQKKMGIFEENPEFFKERSPLHFLENVRAPLLMTASSRDVRCPPTESRAVVKKLKRLGKDIVYHEYPDEGHWPRKRKNLRDLYARSARFLDSRIPR